MRNNEKTKFVKKQNKIKRMKIKEKRNYAYSTSSNNNNIVNLSRSNIKYSIIRWRII